MRTDVILIGWLVVAVGMLIWMWVLVRRADEQAEADEARQVQEDADWEDYLETLSRKQYGKVYDLPRGKEKDFQARSRKAEALGFTDDPPRGAA